MKLVELLDHDAKLTVSIYGVKKARTLTESMEQGYHVEIDGKPLPRCELCIEHRKLVDIYMAENWPEHFRI